MERSVKTNLITYFLAALVVVALGLTFVRYSQSAQNVDKLKQIQEKKNRFPVADYEEDDTNDVEKDRLRKEKQKRYNNFRIVTSKPPGWQTERVVVLEGALNFPALPVVESSFILAARITKAEAHLSENKKNVYSEFTIVVEKIFKSANSALVEGKEVAVDRVGGYVKYPNGRTILYPVSSANMPVVNERYLFFLVSKNSQDLSILTAYALSSDGVSPLDDSSQFDALSGLTEEALIQKLRDTLVASSR
jgi:hypothetical protein